MKIIELSAATLVNTLYGNLLDAEHLAPIMEMAENKDIEREVAL